MVNTGFIIAGAGASVGSTGEPWVNPGNITVSDTSYADASGGSKSEDTYYLKASNFGFSIPTLSRITGIVARIRAYDNYALTNISEVIIGKSDSTLGNDLETGSTALTASLANYDYGSSSNLWGLSWTPTDINASTFQLRLKCNCGGDGSNAGNPYVDAMWVNVYYIPLSINADTKSFTLTGNTAGGAFKRALVISSKPLTLTGVEPTLRASRVLPIASKALSFAGIAPLLTHSRFLPITAKAFTLTRVGAGITAQRRMPITVNPLTLSGQAAELRATRAIYPDARALSLTGEPVFLRFGRSIFAVVSAFGLTLKPAELIAARKVIAATNGLTLTGNAAGLRGAHIITTGTNQLILVRVSAKLKHSAAAPQTFLDLLTRPANTKVVDPKTGVMNPEWRTFFTSAVARINALNPDFLDR